MSAEPSLDSPGHARTGGAPRTRSTSTSTGSPRSSSGAATGRGRSAPATRSRSGCWPRRRSTSSTSTSPSRRGSPRPRCATPSRSTSPPSTLPRSGCSRPRWRGRWSRSSSAASTPARSATPATAELLERYFPGPYELVEAGGRGRDWAAVAAELEAIYLRLAARRHDRRGDAAARRRIAERPLIEVDLHMHTDHSPDCATPVEVLLETARDRGLGAIAITDHNEVSGALEARRIAERDGRHQGDRRRGGEDRRAGRGDRPLPRGEDPEGDDDGGDDRRDPPPGRPRLRAAPLRPLPLGARLRAPARHRRGDRRARGLQPAGRGDRLQRGGRALRPQVPDRPGGRAPTATSPRGSAACGCGSTTSTGRRSSSRRCGTPTSPASTRTSSTCRR